MLRRDDLACSGDYFTESGARLSGGGFEHMISNSGVKTLGFSPTLVVPGNGGFHIIPLLKALFGVCTYLFFRVQTQDLASVGGSGNDGAHMSFPWRHRC